MICKLVYPLGHNMRKKLIQLIKHVSTGLCQPLVLSPDRTYIRPGKNGFQVDSANLKNDVKKIGNDLKKQLSD